MAVLSPEYEHVRSAGDRFLVVPDHIIPDLEQVLEKHSTYWVVEKLGVGSYVADALDPRGLRASATDKQDRASYEDRTVSDSRYYGTILLMTGHLSGSRKRVRIGRKTGPTPLT
jgi:hypothetical protein